MTTLLKWTASAISTICLAVISTTPLTSVLAHEGHKMECSETSIKTLKADVQAMPNGEAKKMAANEMKAAEEMMQKKDLKACVAHLQNAMEATEK